MIGLDQLKYQLGLVSISLDWLILVWLVNIGLDWLILVWICYYWSSFVNIGLDGLNTKTYPITLERIG